MTRLAPVLALLSISALALAGCTPTSEPEADDGNSATVVETAAPEPAAEVTPTPEATAPETCGSSTASLVSYTDDWHVELTEPLKDLGAREFATGEVTVDEDGTLLTYTVEPGDVEAVIAERLCAYPTLAMMNHEHYVYPGLVLWLNPNPDTPWVPLHGPLDAEAGFQQIPYQEAIIEAGVAVDAGDIDTVRAIWNDTLSGMFTDRDTIGAVQQVVDSGDPDALRQLFS